MDLHQRLAELVGATAVRQLHGGHQSQVFEAIGPTPRMVVKVRDASIVDRSVLETRVETTAELATIDPRVCRPLPLDGHLVTAVDAGAGSTALVTCYAYAEGASPDIEDADVASRLGSNLAALHQSMSRIGPKQLPLVATLATARPDWSGPVQLLHGDFSAGNLRLTDDEVRVFDLDDCGYGPPAFDVANSLYTVLFDDLTARQPGAFPTFRDAFLAGYRSASDGTFGPGELSGFIDLRVAALESWLDEPASAPVGIRTSAPEWLATLHSFVDEYNARGDGKQLLEPEA